MTVAVHCITRKGKTRLSGRVFTSQWKVCRSNQSYLRSLLICNTVLQRVVWWEGSPTMPCQQQSQLSYLVHTFRGATCLRSLRVYPTSIIAVLDHTLSSPLSPADKTGFGHTHTLPLISSWTRSVLVDSWNRYSDLAPIKQVKGLLKPRPSTRSVVWVITTKRCPKKHWIARLSQTDNL